MGIFDSVASLFNSGSKVYVAAKNADTQKQIARAKIEEAKTNQTYIALQSKQLSATGVQQSDPNLQNFADAIEQQNNAINDIANSVPSPVENINQYSPPVKSGGVSTTALIAGGAAIYYLMKG